MIFAPTAVNAWKTVLPSAPSAAEEDKEIIMHLPSPLGMAREQLLEVLLREEYGFLPPAPKALRAEETALDKKFCAGKAPLHTIQLTASCDFGDFSFPVRYFCPKADGPVPAVVLLNFRPDVPDRYLPAEEIADAGFAVFSLCYRDVTSDNGDFTDGLAGLVYPEGKRAPNDCGKIDLWAWAALRVFEYALTLPELDHSRISVAGHSRLGKTALLAGALEPRFHCAWSNDSGCGGAALARENTGETVAAICQKFPYWFCGNYYKYVGAEDSMPFDQHFLLAANASHKVYVASAEEDLWACPANEYRSCLAATAYYESMGKTGLISPDRLPEAGDVFHEGQIGYHLRRGCHYMSREDWQQFIRFVSRKN